MAHKSSMAAAVQPQPAAAAVVEVTALKHCCKKGVAEFVLQQLAAKGWVGGGVIIEQRPTVQ